MRANCKIKVVALKRSRKMAFFFVVALFGSVLSQPLPCRWAFRTKTTFQGNYASTKTGTERCIEEARKSLLGAGLDDLFGWFEASEMSLTLTSCVQNMRNVTIANSIDSLFATGNPGRFSGGSLLDQYGQSSLSNIWSSLTSNGGFPAQYTCNSWQTNSRNSFGNEGDPDSTFKGRLFSTGATSCDNS